MRSNRCREAAQPGPGSELLSTRQWSGPAGMQKAPKHTGYQEDVLCRGGTASKAGQGKARLAAVDPLSVCTVCRKVLSPREGTGWTGNRHSNE